MTFVPIVPTRSTDASPNAEELGRRIQVLIREYQQNHPDTSRSDVRQALRIAQMSSGSLPQRKIMVAIALGLVLLIGGLMAFLSVGSRGAAGQPMTMYMIAGIIVVAGLMVGFLKLLR